MELPFELGQHDSSRVKSCRGRKFLVQGGWALAGVVGGAGWRYGGGGPGSDLNQEPV